MIRRKGTVLWSVAGVLVVLAASVLVVMRADVPVVVADAGIPELWPRQVQLGAAANAAGEAVNVWVEFGEIVKVQEVGAEGAISENMAAVAGCNATQATAAIGGQHATVFLLCEHGVAEVVQFELAAVFPGGDGRSDPCWVFLPLVQ